MSSLADQVAERAGNNHRELDDLGIPVPPYLPGSSKAYPRPPVDYVVARMFKRADANHLIIWLDPQDNRLYVGRIQINESSADLTSLSDYVSWYNKGSNHKLIWNRLRELAPRLSMDGLVVTDDLFFNIKEQRLEERKEMHL